MKKLMPVLMLLIVFAVGCSNPVKKPPENKVSPPETEFLKIEPAAQLPAIDPGQAGTVTGTVVINNFENRRGNLFLFTIDQDKLPFDIVVTSSVIYSQKDVQTDKIQFELTGVPADAHEIVAVWDVSQPFCSIAEPFCAASDRDGIGQSLPFDVKPGETTKDVFIAID